MANIDWPTDGSLPYAPDVSGYSNSEEDNVIRSSMGYGPDKVRQRTTLAIGKVSMQLLLDQTQKGALDVFYKQTLHRVLKFNWIDHTTGDPVTYRFLTAPSYSSWNGSALDWAAQFELEIVPT